MRQNGWPPNGVSIGLPGNTLGSFAVNGFWDTRDTPTTLHVAAVEYATMHLMDVSILRLDTTMGDVRSLGVEPLALSDDMPPIGAGIVVVGYPEGGVMMRSRCRAGRTTRVVEDEFLSVVAANDCEGIKHGSSGSPVMDESGHVFGVLSTGPDGTGEPGAHVLCVHAGNGGDLATFMPLAGNLSSPQVVRPTY